MAAQHKCTPSVITVWGNYIICWDALVKSNEIGKMWILTGIHSHVGLLVNFKTKISNVVKRNMAYISPNVNRNWCKNFIERMNSWPEGVCAKEEVNSIKWILNILLLHICYISHRLTKLLLLNCALNRFSSGLNLLIYYDRNSYFW